MNDLDLEGIEREWLVQCGPCDYGLVTMGCNCPSGDYRHIIVKLVAEVRRLRGDLTEQGDRLRETLAKRDELRERLEYAEAAEAELKQSVAARDRLLSTATADRDRLRADLEQASQSLAVSYERLDRLTDPARDRQVAAAALRDIPRLCDDCRINVDGRAHTYAIGYLEVPL